MRVAATAHTQSKPGASKPDPRSLQTAQFKHQVKSANPARADQAWSEFRQLARSMFGSAAFVPSPDGSGQRVSLGKAQLEQLAGHSAHVEKVIQKLQDQRILPPDTRQWTAADAAKLYAQSAQKALPPKETKAFTVETMNDDWGTKKSNLPKEMKATVTMVQEAKNEKVRNLVPKQFGVHQNTARQDQAGTALTWDKQRVKYDQGGYKLGVDHGHDKMLNRWMNWNDVTIDGVKVRMISVHRPPLRYKALWPAFDRNVAAFVKSTKLPVVIGMDSNEAGGPSALARATGLKWVGDGKSIDGFLVSKGVTVEHVRQLAKGTSDHHPLVAKIRVRASKD